MKKFLYGATALVGLVIGNVHAAAEPLKLSLSINMQEWFGIVKHERDAGQDFNTFGVNTDNEIHFKAKTVLENGIEAETFLRLNVYDNNRISSNSGSVGLDEEWVSLGGTFGKVYAGAKDSINKSLHNEPVDYGIGYDDVSIWVLRPTSGPWGSTPLVNGQARTSLEQLANAQPMVGYISPKLAGLQLGLTYVPNVGILGTNSNSGLHTTNHWDMTLAYTREFQGVSLGFDSGFAHQDVSESSAIRNDLSAWNVGCKLGYAGFTLGASFIESQRPGHHADDSYTWNAGLGYANGPWGVSYTYYQERRRGMPTMDSQNEMFRAHLVSGKYILGPGITLKSSFFHGRFNVRNRDVDNLNTWGYGLVSGLDVNF
ncbi:Porin 41 (Por41) precursor [invertebrate metagenome]|uniref:Porin 41 (Por41) n=1 Tax=invertebrate metagenome TaxID=1711999 RepID=A0A484H6U8_9ZZZZ